MRNCIAIDRPRDFQYQFVMTNLPLTPSDIPRPFSPALFPSSINVRYVTWHAECRIQIVGSLCLWAEHIYRHELKRWSWIPRDPTSPNLYKFNPTSSYLHAHTLNYKYLQTPRRSDKYTLNRFRLTSGYVDSRVNSESTKMAAHSDCVRNPGAESRGFK